MTHAKETVFLLGGFILCLLLIVAAPFLRVSRKAIKVSALAIPLLVLLVLIFGRQGMTNRYWIAIVPGVLCLATLGVDVCLCLRQRQSRELVFVLISAACAGWALWVNLLALNSGFMGAHC